MQYIKIAVLTGKRGGYGAMKPMLKLFDKSKFFDLNIIATDQHLDTKFGTTVKEIEKGLNPSDKVILEIKYLSGEIKKVETLCRIDTKNELEYYKNGGILQYVLRNMI